DAAQAKGDAMVRNFRTGVDVPITREQLSELLTLDFANTVEQSPRVYVQDWLIDVYRRASSLLPPAAVSVLNRWKDIKKGQPLLTRALLRARFYVVVLWARLNQVRRRSH